MPVSSYVFIVYHTFVLRTFLQRQSRGRSSSTSRSTSAPSQSRGAHTAAVPAGYSQPHAPAPSAAAANASHAQPKQPGFLAQMAATAGSVAVGSTIGHGLSHALFGGSNEAAPVQSAAPVQNQQANMSCEIQAKGDCHFRIDVKDFQLIENLEFTKCLEKADLQSCSWYLEQLKAVGGLLFISYFFPFLRPTLVSSCRCPLLMNDFGVMVFPVLHFLVGYE